MSQSFVERADDLEALRAAARAAGREPFVIAKIERAGALKHLDEILCAADGLMVARGDLGVEVPIAEMALIQKRLIARANLAGKPVITATQMLESMVSSRLPTRAESTDVANAILDGTDCLMLSAESAIGKYPEEAVAMLARIAAATEPHRPHTRLADLRAVAAEEVAALQPRLDGAVVEPHDRAPQGVASGIHRDERLALARDAQRAPARLGNEHRLDRLLDPGRARRAQQPLARAAADACAVTMSGGRTSATAASRSRKSFARSVIRAKSDSPRR